MSTKHFILLTIIVFMLSSYTEKPYKKGIHFFKGSFEEALVLAQKENKAVFVDFYATWCGPCKQLKRTSFKDEKVGDYYNKNFINISIDAESKEGINIARYYKVVSYPTLIITDYNGRKMTSTTGFKKPHILINFGRRIIP